MKTRKAVASRFKVTGSGKLVRNRPGKRHILTKKTPKRKRMLGKSVVFEGKVADTYKRMMGK